MKALMMVSLIAVSVAAVAALPSVKKAGVMSNGGTAEARTFGGPRKRLLLLLPIMYKLGVITTLLGVLVALAVKSLAVGLLVLALGAANLAVVSKLKGHSHAGWSGGGSYGGGPVHVHVHGSGGGASGHHQAYSAWEPQPVPHASPYTEHYEAPAHYQRKR